VVVRFGRVDYHTGVILSVRRIERVADIDFRGSCGCSCQILQEDAGNREMPKLMHHLFDL
jgi:hypothetical protein